MVALTRLRIARWRSKSAAEVVNRILEADFFNSLLQILAEHHQVIGIPDEVRLQPGTGAGPVGPAQAREVRFHSMEGDVRQQG